MTGRVSALAVLGLRPGADAASVERAYKQLIKQHHPDREGGDAKRAAEINRAYRELRGGKAATDPLEFNEFFERRRHRRWPILILAGLCGGALVMVIGPSAPFRGVSVAHAQFPAHQATIMRPTGDPIEGELHLNVIDAAVGQAVQLYRTRDEMALASMSRQCVQRFRNSPSTKMLDRCAAFDDAVVGMEDRDPLSDGGPFAPLAVTGRQWSAASALSDDYLAIDSRLDSIRLRVELVLAPQIAPIAPAAADSGN